MATFLSKSRSVNSKSRIEAMKEKIIEMAIVLIEKSFIRKLKILIKIGYIGENTIHRACGPENWYQFLAISILGVCKVNVDKVNKKALTKKVIRRTSFHLLKALVIFAMY